MPQTNHIPLVKARISELEAMKHEFERHAFVLKESNASFVPYDHLEEKHNSKLDWFDSLIEVNKKVLKFLME